MPLPGESPGKVCRLERWGKTSLASVSMGQEVSVTTLQLAQAASVVANGGLLVKPRLVLKRGDRTEPVAPPVRILKPETAITMRQMMEGVVLIGTGSRARLAGYSSGGKTGSAQIFDYATQALHAHLQRVVHGLRAGDQSAGGGGGDAERHARRSADSAARRRRRFSKQSPAKRCACSMFRRTCRRAMPDRRWSRRTPTI